MDQRKVDIVEKEDFNLTLDAICSLDEATFEKSWMPLPKNQFITKMYARNCKKLLALHLNDKIDSEYSFLYFFLVDFQLLNSKNAVEAKNQNSHKIFIAFEM